MSGPFAMLNRLSPQKRIRVKETIRHLDRVAADLNVLLILFALGLAVLDLTFLLTQNIVDQLPNATTVTFEAPQSPRK